MQEGSCRYRCAGLLVRFAARPCAVPAAAVRIVPAFGPLTFAEGEVSTVRGAIRFRWENGKLKIRVPENIRCELNSKYETEVS